MTEMFMKVRCMHTGDNCRIHQESETEREREIYIYIYADLCLKDLQASVWVLWCSLHSFELFHSMWQLGSQKPSAQRPLQSRTWRKKIQNAQKNGPQCPQKRGVQIFSTCSAVFHMSSRFKWGKSASAMSLYSRSLLSKLRFPKAGCVQVLL